MICLVVSVTCPFVGIQKGCDSLRSFGRVFYGSKKALHWKELKELAEKIKTPPHCLTPTKIWQAYKQVEDKKVHGRSLNKITDFVSLIRFELEKASELEPFNDTVDKRFSRWLSEQRAKGLEFSQEQLNWLEKIKNHIAESVEIIPDDFEYAPFEQMGGLGKANIVFGKKFNETLIELNEALCA